jgi:ATP-dependent Lhr-like helicase
MTRRDFHGLTQLKDWFARRGWAPFPFQQEVWQAYLAGQSGVVHAATGTGKTLAVWGGPVIEWLNDPPENRRVAPPLTVLWITPLRALAADTEDTLREAADELQLPWRIERRTGDTTAATRKRQRGGLPTALITTPESLSLLLSYPESFEQFAALKLIVVDEWHELLGSKRGVQLELALARLRKIAPPARRWALSATLGNLPEACAVFASPNDAESLQVVRGQANKQVQIESLIPETIERFPWAGHLGIKQAPLVAERISQARSALIFTNTRSQTEIWYRAILELRPEWAGQMAIHHGSLDRKLRAWVEESLREHKLRCVVCTSSLDLGVDFTAVDHVVQVGSPKGIARLMQRAGRSGHQPGQPNRLTFVPTHLLELVELAAARDGVAQGKLEGRVPLPKPLDVLAQHLVTMSLAGGFRESEMLDEVRSAYAYRDLSEREWRWTLDFVLRGGASLQAYPQYHRLVETDGVFLPASDKLARMHRMSIGTITSDAAMTVKYLKGPRIGEVEESFISRLNPGERFLLAGKLLELVRIRDNTAWVRKAKGGPTSIPRWMGGRLPLSTELAAGVRAKLTEARAGLYRGPEMEAVRPMLELQQAWSALPSEDELLIERLTDREGRHLFLYPFEGRAVHEGLAALLALRMSRIQPITFTMAVNDYGLVLLSTEPAPLEAALAEGLLSPEQLAEDISAGLNASEMARRQFRDIARIAGLLVPGYPGQPRNTRQLQASSNLFYEVFNEHDPGNLLLEQARREVLEQQLEQHRLRSALVRLSGSKLVIRDVQRASPLAFPLYVERTRDRVSSEKLADRVRKMQAQLERAASQPFAHVRRVAAVGS